MQVNPRSKKVKGSHLLMVSCGFCQTDIAKYQKLGKGNVLRMYLDRILESSVDFSKELLCPNCGKRLGTRVSLKKKNKEAYKMIRSRFHTRKL